ncbi:MAG: radial spoke head 1 protein [Trebouxia sp. A1-2]|nr:MAG: radial spoke head 1 protein [Trebouxia sp. A1-2]
MAGVEVNGQGQIVALPFRVEKLSFDAKWTSEQAAQLDLDLTCCTFSAEGKLRSFAGPGHSTAEEGGVLHQGTPEGDTVTVYPSKIDPHCEALVFVLSASDSDVSTMSLTTPDTLHFNGYSAELDAPLEPMFQCNLQPHLPTAEAPIAPSTADSQSMIICAMHRSTDSWVTTFSLLSQPSHSWGQFVPKLRTVLSQLPGFPVQKLAAAQEGVVDKVVLLRRFEDRTAEALSCSGQAVQKVRLDFGWEGALVGEGIEGVEMEWNALCYDITGEQTQAVSSKSKEADGITAVPDPPAPEEEEAPPPEADPEAEEGDELKPEAAAEEKLPAAAKNPDEFPQKDGIVIELSALPSATRSIVITINNFAGEGLGPLTCAHLRLTDVTAADATQHKSMGWFRFPSSAGTHKDRPTVESTGSAFSQWRAAASNSDLPAFLADIAVVRSALLNISKVQAAANQLAKTIADKTEAGEEVAEEVKAEERAQWQWRLGCMGRPLPGAALEDSADDLKGIANYEGRFDATDKRHDQRAKAIYANGDTYFGQYSDDRRQGMGLYLVAKGGGYAGSYAQSKRSGQGVMRMPDGAVYQGEFAGDKFEGQGQYEYVDGSTYVGTWKAGKKHGEGVYWDTKGGCLRGTWENGILKGQGTYDQPSYQFKGNFKANLPEGECSFTICAHRTLGMPAPAAAHIMADHGPIITHKGNYTLPPGVGADPPADGEPASEDVVPPAYPKYEGLAYKSAAQLPDEAEDLQFPPASAARPAVVALLLAVA